MSTSVSVLQGCRIMLTDDVLLDNENNMRHFKFLPLIFGVLWRFIFTTKQVISINMKSLLSLRSEWQINWLTCFWTISLHFIPFDSLIIHGLHKSLCSMNNLQNLVLKCIIFIQQIWRRRVKCQSLQGSSSVCLLYCWYRSVEQG